MAAHLPDGDEAFVEISRILLPTDFSEFSLAAVDPAVTLAQSLGAKVDLLFVLEDLPSVPILTFEHLPAGTAERFYEESRARSEEILEQTMQKQIPIEHRGETRIRRGPAAAGITQTAEELPADMIVMTTHGRSGWKNALLGSVTERVVRTAPCPVLTVRISKG
jgi:nucleotide-binding universal stress UspA family protein